MVRDCYLMEHILHISRECERPLSGSEDNASERVVTVGALEKMIIQTEFIFPRCPRVEDNPSLSFLYYGKQLDLAGQLGARTQESPGSRNETRMLLIHVLRELVQAASEHVRVVLTHHLQGIFGSVEGRSSVIGE